METESLSVILRYYGVDKLNGLNLESETALMIVRNVACAMCCLGWGGFTIFLKKVETVSVVYS